MTRAWAVLLASAVAEAVWATALGASEGLTRPGPTVVFGVFTILSMLGLGRAMQAIAVGTAYAVWTGVGAALTVVWAMLTGAEEPDPVRLLFVAGIVGAVVGLKLAAPAQPGRESSTAL